jgi:hypothetical protein
MAHASGVPPPAISRPFLFLPHGFAPLVLVFVSTAVAGTAPVVQYLRTSTARGIFHPNKNNLKNKF